MLFGMFELENMIFPWIEIIFKVIKVDCKMDRFGNGFVSK